MRLRLFHKFFFTMVIVSFASIVIFAIAVNWYFSRAFIEYLNTEQEQWMSELSTRLGEHYAEQDGFSSLQQNPRNWRSLLHRFHDAQRPRQGKHPGRPPLWRKPPTLLGANKTPLVGPPDIGDLDRVSPIVVNGETVGWLSMPRLERPNRPRDVRFAERLPRILFIATLIALSVATLGAFFTTRKILKPLRRVTEGTQALTAGQLDTRLPTDGSDELALLGNNFNDLARTLQHNESERRRFFADMSHELKTPLAIMRGELEAVSDGVRPNDQRLIESLMQETTLLERLLDDLYHLARTDVAAMNYSFESVLVAQVVNDAIERVRPRLESAGFRITSELDETVTSRIDRNRIMQLVENILENARRYALPPGPVHLTLSEGECFVQLGIEDHGPGVTEDALGRLFEPLYRAEPSRNRRDGGSGLGLAICERIARGHDGAISAKLNQHGGLAITLSLPREH